MNIAIETSIAKSGQTNKDSAHLFLKVTRSSLLQRANSLFHPVINKERIGKL